MTHFDPVSLVASSTVVWAEAGGSAAGLRQDLRLRQDRPAGQCQEGRMVIDSYL